MKRSLLLLSMAVLGLTLTSCWPEYRLERKEDRLIGSWYFEDAFFRENGDLFRERVTSQFYGDIIEFYPDFEAYYDDDSERYGYWGEWEMYYDRAFYDGDDDVDFYLNMYFYDDRGREIFGYDGAVTLLTRNKLNLRANTRAGVYTFRLRKAY